MKLHYYSDPGHGWLAVKRNALYDLGVAFDVSTYSYQRGKTVYLEEDCDMSLFCRAAKARGWPLEFVDHSTNKNSPIRSYEHYSTMKGD